MAALWKYSGRVADHAVPLMSENLQCALIILNLVLTSTLLLGAVVYLLHLYFLHLCSPPSPTGVERGAPTELQPRSPAPPSRRPVRRIVRTFRFIPRDITSTPRRRTLSE